MNETYCSIDFRISLEIEYCGLTPFEFRLYAYIGRRQQTTASQKTIAEVCKMSRTTLKKAANGLIRRGLIAKVANPDGTISFILRTDKL